MIQETDKRIAEVCMRFPEYPFLLSIPGFGPDVSAKVLGALGNPSQIREPPAGAQDGRSRPICR